MTKAIFPMLNKYVKLLFYSLAAISGGYFIWRYFGFTVDDAWITFRYGKNLIAHGVWNYNNTNQFVEAYTNPIYAFLSILPHALGISPEAFFKGVSLLIFGLFIAFILKSGKPRAFTFFFVATFPLFFIHLFSGLETPLFILLIYLLAKYEDVLLENPYLFFSMVFMFPLTRPEGAVFSAAITLTAVYKRKINIIVSACIAAAILGVYFVIRYKYFDSFLPNTFYVKTGKHYVLNIVSALKDTWMFWLLPLLSMVALKRYSALKYLLISLTLWVFLYSPSDLQMNYASRFLFQLFFPFMLLAIEFWEDQTTSLSSMTGKLKCVSYAAILLLLIVSFRQTDHSKAELKFLTNYSAASDSSHKVLADNLKAYPDLRMLMGDAGIFPYYSDLYIIDLVGLANKEIARKGLSMEYLQQEKPQVILLYAGTKTRDGIYMGAFKQDLVLQYIDATNDFEQVSSIKTLDGNHLVVFAQKSYPKFSEISDILKKHESTNEEFFKTLAR